MDAAENGLLAALSQNELKRLRRKLELVDLACGQVLYESVRPLNCAYFLTTATVALHFPLEQRTSVKIALVGSEGLIGIPLFFGGMATQGCAIVQCPGQAFRLNAQAVAGEVDAASPLLQMVLRYAHTLIALLMQTAACQRHHSFEQHLCRWLLLTQDRLGDDDIAISQEQIAQKLGVRRESVTEAAARLRSDGLIRSARGHIILLDRPGIEQRACECYARGKTDIDRLLPRRHAR